MKCALNDLDLKNNLDYFEKECKDKSKQKVSVELMYKTIYKIVIINSHH